MKFYQTNLNLLGLEQGEYFSSRIIYLFFALLLTTILLSLIGATLEKLWSFFQNLINDRNGSEENFGSFTSLDQSTIQVITDTKIRFEDVAGNEEAKEELKEVVKFLREPEIFAKLGAGIPKGVLLGGPPGTGKTLLAKAIAGEAGVPFLKVSGSQFVELLVGVGAGRVRELFDKARSLKPSIIFIDEIDAIARSRSSGNMGGGNDEREQTLNQILTEMDGFKVDSGIVVIAATNRIDILDPAIKRPGRFDRQIMINNPNLRERQAILKVHARNKKLDSSISIFQIAQRTIGFSGADLANLMNESAILAARRKKSFIGMDEINSSIDKLIIGLQGKPASRVKVRQLVAFHEMGHAILGTLINAKEGIEKLTLIPRGSTQGTTWKIPSPSQYNSRENFLSQIIIAISGRAAEEIIYGESEVTAGAQEDLAEITRTIRTMILRYAMTRLQEFKQQAQQRNLYLLGSDAKEELNNTIDNFTTNFVDLTYQQVIAFLKIIRPKAERLVDELLVAEELNGQDLRNLLCEYLSNINKKELLYDTRESALFGLIFELFSPKEIEDILNKTKAQNFPSF